MWETLGMSILTPVVSLTALFWPDKSCQAQVTSNFLIKTKDPITLLAVQQPCMTLKQRVTPNYFLFFL